MQIHFKLGTFGRIIRLCGSLWETLLSLEKEEK
jgi:hypothetical protein